MDKSAKIFVAGHRGLVGSALVRALTTAGYGNLILRTRQELDLLDQRAVRSFFEAERPEYVFLAAAKVGGILANKNFKADFIWENLEVQNNVIRNAHDFKVKKLMFLGSSCIYPRMAEQPIREEYLLQGGLEPTNDAYAIAKIAGIMMCQSFHTQYGSNFISVMPTNLYGPNDNFDLQSSHVLPAMIRKFHDAKLAGHKPVELWGTGSAFREFLHVDDLADACLFLMQSYDSADFVNIGTGHDISIRDLAGLVQRLVGHQGTIAWDATKPDGTPRKRLDVSRLNKLGWSPKISLEQGITQTYQWFTAQSV
jgi:GDP-L-fucose synthase